MRVFLDFADPNGGSKHANQGAGGGNKTDLFAAESEADIKKIHER